MYAADKLAKTRELRSQAANGSGEGEAELDRRLEHYEESLRMLQAVAGDLPFVHQLAFELWAMTRLPPRGRDAWRGRAAISSGAG